MRLVDRVRPLSRRSWAWRQVASERRVKGVITPTSFYPRDYRFEETLWLSTLRVPLKK